MEVNKEIRERYEDFLSKLHESRNNDTREEYVFTKLFRKIILNIETTIPKYSEKKRNTKEIIFAHQKAVEEIQLTPEMIYLIEKTLLDEKFTWTIHDFLSIFMSKEIKISKNVLDKLCGHVLTKKISSSRARHIAYYIECFGLKEYCPFFKDLIEILVDDLDYNVYPIVNIAGEMGCMGCYESIEKILVSEDHNGWALDSAEETLKKLDKLKNESK